MDKTSLQKPTLLTPIELEKQEALTNERLSKLIATAKPALLLSPRPTDNFYDLMKWVKTNYQTNPDDSTCFVHNRIVIDGQFLQYCEENNISVECLHQDSVISWQTSTAQERFFAQGIFKIKKDDLEFIHAALYHKGNQYEDEISFFVVVQNNSFEKYLEFRNKFDAWLLVRDRNNLQVHVVEGEDISYDNDISWDDLYLPENVKQEIRSSVEGFLSSKEFYRENKIPWKMGILLFGEPGNGKSSCVKTLIATYNFKAVTIAPHAGDEAVREAFAYAEEQSPALLYFEDLDSLLEHINVSAFLNLLDGVATKNGLLVVATANKMSKLEDNIKRRPSRFDRKWEIPLPDKEMAVNYLKKWFGTMLTAKKIDELALDATKNKFSYAYLKDLYISSFFIALSNNRTKPSVSDVNDALKQVKNDRKISGGTTFNLGIDKYIDSPDEDSEKSAKKTK